MFTSRCDGCWRQGLNWLEGKREGKEGLRDSGAKRIIILKGNSGVSRLISQGFIMVSVVPVVIRQGL